ncbi:hypothetical protein [Pelistega europaea]|uniref:Transmembrane protein n=1 Tax=Pelistega europaea TaxID=106147 RepID=A0A7Y4P450_9BURK|nr:hypothetical protein [Pelistega europaea]NOL49126.1 hypothetical protein [Pelistega europaea]
MDFLRQLFRGAMVLLFTLVGLGMAFALLVVGVVSLGIMYLVYLIRGQKFSATEYWQQSRARAKQTSSQFSGRFRQPSYSRRPAQDVSDAEVREIKHDT